MVVKEILERVIGDKTIFLLSLLFLIRWFVTNKVLVHHHPMMIFSSSVSNHEVPLDWWERPLFCCPNAYDWFSSKVESFSNPLLRRQFKLGRIWGDDRFSHKTEWHQVFWPPSSRGFPENKTENEQRSKETIDQGLQKEMKWIENETRYRVGK